MNIAIIGAGWAGCAAAVEATRLGQRVTLFEAARTPGGRARRLDITQGDHTLVLDNGQHILIGAYVQTLRLMADVGIDTTAALLRLPLNLTFPDGQGFKLPASRWLPAPLDALVGILTARGWSVGDKLSLLRASVGWQLRQFSCAPGLSVFDVCAGVSARVMATLIEPLCVSALNTPPERACGQVFLRVLRDALFASSGASNLLLPTTDLSALLPDAALSWLVQAGGQLQVGCRVNTLKRDGHQWVLGLDSPLDSPEASTVFDQVILACPSSEAARLAAQAGPSAQPWVDQARGLQHEAIATVYALAPGVRLAQPMLALRANPCMPAQYVFDRGQLGGSAGLLAFVVSASQGSHADITRQVTVQAAEQLGLHTLQVLQTVVEKRATFACTPGLVRPASRVTEGLMACGDYLAGPYPATLEGAVRSGLAAARRLGT